MNFPRKPIWLDLYIRYQKNEKQKAIHTHHAINLGAKNSHKERVLFISNLLAREIGFEGSKTIRESAMNAHVTQHSQQLKLKTLISIRMMIKC